MTRREEARGEAREAWKGWAQPGDTSNGNITSSFSASTWLLLLHYSTEYRVQVRYRGGKACPEKSWLSSFCSTNCDRIAYQKTARNIMICLKHIHVHT